MIEGKIEIYLSHKEPIFRERTLWLRPYLDREGYELLYYGSTGWTPLIYESHQTKEPIINNNKVNNCIEESIQLFSSCNCKKE